MHLSSLAYILSAYLASADDQSRIASAVVAVDEFAPITLGTGVTWQDVPDSLAGATIFEQARKPLNELRFTVKEGGLVVLAASWKPDGNGKGNWKKDRTTDAMLLRDGWTAIGKITRIQKNGAPDPHSLYRRLVKAGDSFKIHTRQVKAPLLILPTIDHVSEVLAIGAAAELPLAGVPIRGAAKLSGTRRQQQEQDFTDKLGADALLVGFRLTTDYVTPNWGISSVQPIYETAAGRKAGEQHGDSGPTTVELEAKPGYAVGAILGSTKAQIAGLRVVFMRRSKEGLDANDSYESRWVGARSTAEELRLGGDGTPLVGIRGTAGQTLRTLELIPAGQ